MGRQVSKPRSSSLALSKNLQMLALRCRRVTNSLQSGYIGDQCEHFHLNILASDVCIHDELQKVYGSGMIINRLYEVSELFNEWGEYLFFENSIGEARYYISPK